MIRHAILRRAAIVVATLSAPCAAVAMGACSSFDGERDTADAAPASDAQAFDAPVTPDGDARADVDVPDVPLLPPCVPGVAGCARYVFVTSQIFDGNLGGRAGGDGKCAAAAASASAKPHITARAARFRAWLGTTSVSAAGVFVGDARPFVRTDGMQIAASRAALTSGTLERPINRTEADVVVTEAPRVWTGALGNGDLDGTKNCDDWLSTAGNGRLGNPTATTAQWTTFTDLSCAQSHRLYCIEL